jgi:hypothetical protein
MRHLFMIVLFFCFVTPAVALTSAVTFINQLPDAPSDCCPDDRAVSDAFEEKVRNIEVLLDEELAKRKKIVDEVQGKGNKKMQEAAMDQPGFQGKSSAEMKSMSRAEKRKQADQMMQQKFGMSLEEMKKVKNMSKEGQKNWGQAAMAQMQAESTIDPQKAASDQQNAMKTAGLAGKQMESAQRIQAIMEKYDSKFNEVEENATGRQMLENIKYQEKALEQLALNGATCKERTEKATSINALKTDYCRKMSGRYAQLVKEFRTGMIQAFPDYDQLDQIEAEIQKMQFGADMPAEQSGISGLKDLRKYMQRLRAVHQYNLYLPSAEQCDGQQ